MEQRLQEWLHLNFVCIKVAIWKHSSQEASPERHLEYLQGLHGGGVHAQVPQQVELREALHPEVHIWLLAPPVKSCSLTQNLAITRLSANVACHISASRCRDKHFCTGPVKDVFAMGTCTKKAQTAGGHAPERAACQDGVALTRHCQAGARGPTQEPLPVEDAQQGTRSTYL
jgi:hypothetical protein